MSFRESLESLVGQLRTAAIERHKWDNETIFTLEDNDTTVKTVPGTRMGPEGVAALQRELDRLHADLDSLEQRFAAYYALDRSVLPSISRHLGGRVDIGGGKPTLEVYEGVPLSLCERLHDAETYWISPLAEHSSDPSSFDHRYGYWTGPAATAFNEYFLLPFEAAAERQIAFAKLLTWGVEAFLAGVILMQDTLRAIAEASIAALVDPGSRPPLTLSDVLTAVSIATTVAGFIPGLGQAATLILGGVSFVTGLAAGATEDDSEEPVPAFGVAGGFATEIVVATLDAITDLEKKLADEDADISGWLNQLAGANAGYLEKSVAGAGIAGARGESGGFGTVDSTDAAVVVAEVAEIYKAGHVILPAAAAEYERARQDLDYADTPRSVGMVFPRSLMPYETSRDRLRSVLVSVRDALTETGRSLVAIAKAYEWQDAASAESFNQVTAGVEPDPDAYNHPDHQQSAGPKAFR